MIGLDTNVLIRYLIHDDPEQAKTAKKWINTALGNGEEFFIHAVVLCELVWVLESVYSFEKAQVIKLLNLLARTREFHFDDHEFVHEAIGQYEKGSGDFSDYLIGLANARTCSITLTFDKKLNGASIFQVLKN